MLLLCPALHAQTFVNALHCFARPAAACTGRCSILIAGTPGGLLPLNPFTVPSLHCTPDAATVCVRGEGPVHALPHVQACVQVFMNTYPVCAPASPQEGGETAFPRNSEWYDPEIPKRLEAAGVQLSKCAQGHVAGGRWMAHVPCIQGHAQQVWRQDWGLCAMDLTNPATVFMCQTWQRNCIIPCVMVFSAHIRTC